MNEGNVMLQKAQSASMEEMTAYENALLAQAKAVSDREYQVDQKIQGVTQTAKMLETFFKALAVKTLTYLIVILITLAFGWAMYEATPIRFIGASLFAIAMFIVLRMESKNG